MILQEPKVEFVPIDQNVFTTQQTSSGCPDWDTQTPAGGGQRCIASQIDARDCEDFIDSMPWIDD